jgi:hypothetical protein
MTIRRITIIALLVSLASPASAAPSARELFERAKQAYMQAQAERSLKLLGRAARLVRDTKLSATIELYTGLNLLVTNKRPEAEAAFKRALRHDPTLSLDKERFKPSTVRLLEQIKAAARATLVVTANRPGEVWIDGVKRGQTPLTAQVTIGKHQIRVQAGSARFDVTIVIGAGAQLTVPAHLPASGTTSATKRAAGEDDKRKAQKPAGPSRLWTWVALGTAVAAAGAGLTFGLLANKDHDDYMSTRDYDRFKSAEDSTKTKALLSNVFFISAGVIAAGAVALFFIEGRAPAAKERPARDTALRLTPAIGPGGGGVSLDLRF